MMNNWKSLGLVIKTQKKFNWLQSHMWVPIVDNVDNIINHHEIKLSFDFN
mgnify:CR=1 FL=1